MTDEVRSLGAGLWRRELTTSRWQDAAKPKLKAKTKIRKSAGGVAKSRNLDESLPPIVTLPAIFKDLVSRVDLSDTVKQLAGRTLRVGTMCRYFFCCWWPLKALTDWFPTKVEPRVPCLPSASFRALSRSSPATSSTSNTSSLARLSRSSRCAVCSFVRARETNCDGRRTLSATSRLHSSSET